MNKSTSQPELRSKVLRDRWLYRPPENQQIQQFKVVVKHLPHMQKHKWPNRHFGKQGVSLGNLECIVENSLEESSFVNSSIDEIDHLEFIDSADSLDEVDLVGKPAERNAQFNEPTSDVRVSKVSNDHQPPNKESICTISSISNQLCTAIDDRTAPNGRPAHADNQTRSKNTSSSNLHTKKRSNYESNLNNFAANLNTKSNYKPINTDDNFFFGPPNQVLEEHKLRNAASNRRQITRRQNFCDFLTVFLVLTAFISIFVAIVLLFLIALDAWSMQLAFTITLIILCILTVLLVLFASFTANFFWYFNSKSNSIDWMLHYGRKVNSTSDYYFGKSQKANDDEENNNEIESNLIQQV